MVENMTLRLLPPKESMIKGTVIKPEDDMQLVTGAADTLWESYAPLEHPGQAFMIKGLV